MPPTTACTDAAAVGKGGFCTTHLEHDVVSLGALMEHPELCPVSMEEGPQYGTRTLQHHHLASCTGCCKYEHMHAGAVQA